VFGRKYKYFVSYGYQQYPNNKDIGNGMIEIITIKPIKTYEDISDIAEHIREKHDWRSVVILNYKKIK
jgi:FtsZ-interacting cell division protein YlmF